MHPVWIFSVFSQIPQANCMKKSAVFTLVTLRVSAHDQRRDVENNHAQLNLHIELISHLFVCYFGSEVQGNFKDNISTWMWIIHEEAYSTYTS